MQCVTESGTCNAGLSSPRRLLTWEGRRNHRPFWKIKIFLAERTVVLVRHGDQVGAGANGAATSQLVSAGQPVAVSQGLEPPLLAR